MLRHCCGTRHSGVPACRRVVSYLSGPRAVSAHDVSLQSVPFLRGQVRWKHPYKPRTREVQHPHIPHPENMLQPRALREAATEGNALFIPENYQNLKELEAMRTGEYLGEDYPYKFLSHRYWRGRKYNVLFNKYNWSFSDVKGVTWHERLRWIITEWVEDGKPRHRAFVSNHGLLRAKKAAERFRRSLEVVGRVDNRRTERQLKERNLAKKAERELRRYRYHLVIAGKRN
uniref:Uncharacterized protein n=1 Tax=Chromera velia CCMP2878 TaxID=1169474 RepID=A0A0G4HLA6_9ALVE|mmetsp:Transcript_3386/g.7000  ORF Transcript_3386/g.7000 Transcript_3386/m.7000 type:complete len:230 (-) Transcript_3386:156-845(-)|eukprot:Cvel_1125.t1-p1 / transcript=Cvel_1125.t1 / gene=Cvel_1125 / organism=Chromera_velia_CCMP2878 / gene_product=hypothetical protein / transcript_product=hypothetical protein / location=Cvel_scaffold37:15258-19689(+) / protein_length=229 / sequence_SO=supercontig / SO=protein_coding / is_pseudo=false